MSYSYAVSIPHDKPILRYSSRYCGVNTASAIISPMDGGQRIDIDRLRAAVIAAQAAGISFRQLSKAAGMEENWARQFVKGRSQNPKIDTLSGLAEALNRPVEDFLLSTGNRSQADPSPLTISLPVLIPNAAILMEAFRSILLGVAPPLDAVDSLAQELAEHFPAALEGALFRSGQRRSPTAPAKRAPSPRATDSK